MQHLHKVDWLELLQAVAAATEKEVRDCWMGPGMTLQELIDKYGQPDGTLKARVGTDDMRSAYRRIQCSQQGYTVVCVYTFGEQPGQLFFPVYGFNFGHVSSVVQYNRAPELLVHVARKLFLYVTEHYVDDYATIDVVGRRNTKSDNVRQWTVRRKLREIDWLKRMDTNLNTFERAKIDAEPSLLAEQAGFP
jgi:hypothetical protein